MLTERNEHGRMKEAMLESLLDLYELGGVELAAAAAQDFVCHHADDDDMARCAICHWGVASASECSSI